MLDAIVCHNKAGEYPAIIGVQGHTMGYSWFPYNMEALMRIHSRLLPSPSSKSASLSHDTNLITPTLDLRIWRDEHMGLIWRMAYNDGHGETLVSFPDTAAMGDFIAEQLGLTMIDALNDPGDYI